MGEKERKEGAEVEGGGGDREREGSIFEGPMTEKIDHAQTLMSLWIFITMPLYAEE